MKPFLNIRVNSNVPNPTFPRVMIYDYHQDDPRKCTSARLRKFRLARDLRLLEQIPSKAIVLNPTASKTLSNEDHNLVEKNGIVGIDCSWNLSENIFDRSIRGENRRLPILLAGNPISYGLQGRLSTAEAIAAALFLTGYTEYAEKILSIFKWGSTFLSLNREPLEKYSLARSSDLSVIELEYFSPKI